MMIIYCERISQTRHKIRTKMSFDFISESAGVIFGEIDTRFCQFKLIDDNEMAHRQHTLNK